MKDKEDKKYLKGEKKKIDFSTAMKDCYYTLIDILKKYVDMEEKDYVVNALWIMGTYAHDEFEAYPYKYFNAPKGSAKTRILKLISALAKNGRMIGSLTEAVLFRTAKGRTFCIDEFEKIASPEHNALRELLNSAYKKGMVIERSKKQKNSEGEGYKIESFDVYTSVAMANISGMEEVLGDRCIITILEKSTKPKITKLIERFNKDFSIQKIKKLMEEIKEKLCSLVSEKDFSGSWNDYVLGERENKEFIKFFKKVDKTGIEGRNLELLFPLYFIASLVDDETLDKMLEISQEIVREREEEDYFENRDKILMKFLAEMLLSKELEFFDYVSIAKLTNLFRDYQSDDNEWINPKWIGVALKRMKFLKHRKRTNRGVFVLLNTDKIKKKG